EQFISETKSLLSQANIGSELYAQLSEQLSDSSQVSQLLQQYVANGITGADLSATAQELKVKLMNGEIDDDTMQQYVDQLNEKLKEKFDEDEWPNVLITFDADTKNIVNAAEQQEKEAQKTAKAWNAAASAVSSVGAAMQKIEDPGIKAMGTVIQSIASIALGFAQASVQASSLGPWGWLAFLGAGSAAMATTISTVHSLTGFANGGVYDGPSGFVPGNKYSGDNVMANGGTVGLNSGELILNRAQQGVIAQELESGGFDSIQLEAVIGAEEIMLVTNNRGNRTQRGEYVQSNNRRG
nr:hypothetical protein [Prevotella sp.]